MEGGIYMSKSMKAFVDSFCFGPCDLLSISKGNSTLHLSLKDSAGRLAHATYQGCVYWRLPEHSIDKHISFVQRVSAAELLAHPNSITIHELKKNANNVADLLHEWEHSGLSFFIHLGNQLNSEYLVVAKSLTYCEDE